MTGESILTIVICTRDRSYYLDRALLSLTRQSIGTESFDVIVVDNGSSDNTRQIVEGYQSKLNIQYLRDDVVGLSHARNTGWASAKGDYVVYLDDDGTAFPDWLEQLLRAIKTWNPDIIGGPYYAEHIHDKPYWFDSGMGTCVPFANSGLHTYEEYKASGGNMAIRRSLFMRIGGFSEGLGMRGEVVIYGEETDFQMRASRAIENFRLYFCLEAAIYHTVIPSKYSVWWWIRSSIQRGKASALLRENYTRGRFSALGCLVKNLLLGCYAYIGALKRRHGRMLWAVIDCRANIESVSDSYLSLTRRTVSWRGCRLHNVTQTN